MSVLYSTSCPRTGSRCARAGGRGSCRKRKNEPEGARIALRAGRKDDEFEESRAPAEDGNQDAALALAQWAWPGECARLLNGATDTKIVTIIGRPFHASAENMTISLTDPFTKLTIRQIAQRLDTGSLKSLNDKLYLAGKQAAKESKAKKAKM